MSKMIIIEGNSNDRNNVRAYMVKGEQGSNIQSITKTSTSGLVDTYTVTLTNGDTSTFQVTNGSSFGAEVVSVLPTQDISTSTIYLVAKTGSSGDVFNEYIYVNSNWELIGSTEVDISGKLDTSKVKTSYSSTSGDVYDVTYINTTVGDIGTVLNAINGEVI